MNPLHEKGKTLIVHSKLSLSRANGPDLRAVVWLQGCSVGCPGCFNPALQKMDGGRQESIDALFRWLIAIKNITGVTISGGEPTDQLPGLLSLVRRIKQETELSILLFSGKTLEQLLSFPDGSALISLLDVLIDGPYDLKKSNAPGMWPSSTNQKIRLLTDRHKKTDFSKLAVCEVVITEHGEVMESGMLSGLMQERCRG